MDQYISEGTQKNPTINFDLNKDGQNYDKIFPFNLLITNKIDGVIPQFIFDNCRERFHHLTTVGLRDHGCHSQESVWWKVNGQHSAQSFFSDHFEGIQVKVLD